MPPSQQTEALHQSDSGAPRASSNWARSSAERIMTAPRCDQFASAPRTFFVLLAQAQHVLHVVEAVLLPVKEAGRTQAARRIGHAATGTMRRSQHARRCRRT